MREYVHNYHGIHQQRLLHNIKQSPYFVEKLAPWKVLRGHDGCVNSVLFSDTGEFIFTGSDDTKVNIYSSNTGKLLKSINTIHTQNIFYAKDFPQYSNHIDYILSCGADGKVILTNLERNAGKLIYRHRGRSHRISLVPNEPYQFMSCGEDGVCCLFDLREKFYPLFHDYNNVELQQQLQEQIESNSLPSLKINFKPKAVTNSTTSTRPSYISSSSAYCLGINPLNNFEVAIGGTNTKVLLHDTRFPKDPFGFLCPEHLLDGHTAHVTGLKYSYNGALLLASYNDDDVYSFNVARHSRLIDESEFKERVLTSAYRTFSSFFQRFSNPASASESDKKETADADPFNIPDEELDGDLDEQNRPIDKKPFFFRRYNGHRNSDTVKQVAFMGNRSEWVVSGSDCGHIFIWETKTGRLVKVLYGDSVGAVNCLASHPQLPLLATSGLENNAKLWYPMGEHTSIERDGDEKEKVDTIIQSNRERDQSSFMSSRTLRTLIRMLANSAFDLEDLEEVGGEEEGESRRRRPSEESPGEGEEGNTRRLRRRIALDDIIPLLDILGYRAVVRRRGEEEEDDDDDDDEDEEEDDDDDYDSGFEEGREGEEESDELGDDDDDEANEEEVMEGTDDDEDESEEGDNSADGKEIDKEVADMIFADDRNEDLQIPSDHDQVVDQDSDGEGDGDGEDSREANLPVEDDD
jgi:WD repeat-containing protein 42A